MRYRILLVGAAAALGACGNAATNPPVTDAAVVDVVAPQDTPTPDVPAADTGADAVSDARADVRDAGGPLCNSVPIEDAERLGQRMGATLRIVGDNRAANASTTRGIQAGTTAAPCNFRTAYQRVFSYTLRDNASLRVSTSNPGTDRTFDTTLVIYNGRTCVTQFRTLFCNDDDATLPTTAQNRFTSRIATGAFTRNDTVLIGVGGYATVQGMAGTTGDQQGAFELSIEEVPLIADGMPCRRDGTTGSCGIDSTCVGDAILGETGTCRANGSAPGTRCAMTVCNAGLECDTDNNLCYRRVADGMPCDRFTDGWARCGNTSTCQLQGTGNVVGVCRAHGSANNTECAAGGTCAMGLSCRTAATTPTCGLPPGPDGACNTTDTVCPMGQSCVPDSPAVFTGRCRTPGSVLGAPCMGTCEGGNTCSTATTPTCVRPAMTGERCSARAPCPTGNTCYLTNLVDRYSGVCFAPGVLGGPCRGTGAPCDGGAVCSNATTPASGRCLREVAIGGACELVGPTRCAMGSSCVRNAGSSTTGTCRAEGTVAGAACRAMGTRCDSGLTCSAMTGAGICQSATTTDCDPRFNTRACPMGQTCRASAYEVGACAAPGSMEMEANNGPSTRQALTGASGSVRGALTRYDTDCFGVEVPAGGRVFARVAAPNGFCPTGTNPQVALDLYDAAGRWLGSNTNSGPFGCPLIDGADSAASGIYPWAANLAAGTYAICVRNPDTTRAPVAEYVLDWSVSGAAMGGDAGAPTDASRPDGG